MASLEKRGRNFRIVFRYRSIKYARALKTRDERTARSCLSRLEDNLHRLELGTLAPPANVDLASFLLSDGRMTPRQRFSSSPLPPAGDSLTLAALFAVYFANLPDGNLEQITIQGMEGHQRQLQRHFQKDFLISALTLTHLQGYVEKRSHDNGLKGRKVSPITIKKAIVTLRTVWNWGRQHGLLEKMFPCKGLKYPKGIEKPPFMTFAEIERRAAKLNPAEAADLWECAFLTLDEIDELLKVVEARARHPFLNPMVVFAAHTGARRSEMLRSKICDLDFDSSLITIRERKKSHDKRTTRRVQMSVPLREVLRSWLEVHPGGEYTFCHGPDVARSRSGRQQISPLTCHEAHDHFKRTLIGTKWEKLRGWHVFRHSFCSNCAAKGIDQRIIDAWVGHLSPEMVRRYRHLFPDQQQAAINLVFSPRTACALG